MKKITYAAAVAALVFAGAANAAGPTLSNPLAGLSGDIGIGTLKHSGADDDATQIRATVSYVLAPNWAADVMGSTTWSKGGSTGGEYNAVPAYPNSVWRESQKFSATTLGLYVRPHFAVTDTLELYGRAGVSHVRLKVSDSKTTSSNFVQDHTTSIALPEDNGHANKTGFSYGFGVKGTFSKNWTASLDYTNYYDKNGIKLDGVTLSTGYAF